MHETESKNRKVRHKTYNPDQIETTLGRIFSTLEILGKGGWKRPVFGAIVTAIFDMLTLYFFFIAAGYPVEPEILIIGSDSLFSSGKLRFSSQEG